MWRRGRDNAGPPFASREVDSTHLHYERVDALRRDRLGELEEKDDGELLFWQGCRPRPGSASRKRAREGRDAPPKERGALMLLVKRPYVRVAIAIAILSFDVVGKLSIQRCMPFESLHMEPVRYDV